MYRFAFSPSRDMHLSDLRVALLNYSQAKKDDKGFIIRVEDGKDLDDKYKETLEILNLCGIGSETLYYQSNNLKFHRQFAMSLMGKQQAFSCFCSEKKLAKKKGFYDGTCEKLDDFDVLNNENPFSIRIKSKSKDMDSFIIMTHDKYPTSTFAAATDDMLQGVTDVILEESQKQNAKDQEFIRETLGYTEKINYSFVPTLKKDKKVKELLDSGFLPSAIVEYLIPQKSLEKFDIKELSKINREHIKQMDDLKLSTLVGFADEGIGKLAKLYTSQASTINEIKTKIDAIFATKNIPEEFQAIKEATKQAPYFENFSDYENYLIQKTGEEATNISEALNFLLKGKDDNMEVYTLYPHLKNYIKEILR